MRGRRQSRHAPDRHGGLAPELLAALLVASAAPAAGQEREIVVPEPAEVCASCHAFTPDEPALEGPLLWGVVGRRIASVEGFEYSAALRKLAGSWDRPRLERFLSAPQSYAPGTKMDMGGVRNAVERGVVLDFLESLAPGRGQ